MSDDNFNPVDQDARQKAGDGPRAQSGAYDQRRSSTQRSRALEARNAQPTTAEARLAKVENSLATMGGRSVAKHGDVLTVRPEQQLPEVNVNVIWNGQASVIAIRARVIS